MHTNHGPKEDPLTDLGYEPRDVNVGALGKWTIGLFGFIAISIVISWFVIAGANCGPVKFDGLGASYSGHPDQFKARKIPGEPYPLLQNNVTAKADIMDVRREEETRLHGYGWANTAKSRATLPVDKAIELIALRGAPKTGNQVPAVSKGNVSDQRKDVVPGVTTDPAPPAGAKSTNSMSGTPKPAGK